MGKQVCPACGSRRAARLLLLLAFAVIGLASGVRVGLFASGETAASPPGAEGIVGEPVKVAEALRSFVELGVTHLVVSVTPGGIAGIERFGRVLDLLDQDEQERPAEEEI